MTKTQEHVWINTRLKWFGSLAVRLSKTSFVGFHTARPLATSSLAVGRFAAKQGSFRAPRGRLVASLPYGAHKAFSKGVSYCHGKFGNFWATVSWKYSWSFLSYLEQNEKLSSNYKHRNLKMWAQTFQIAISFHRLAIEKLPYRHTLIVEVYRIIIS